MIWNQEAHLDQDSCANFFETDQSPQSEQLTQLIWNQEITSIRVASPTCLESGSPPRPRQLCKLFWTRSTTSTRTATPIDLESGKSPQSEQFYQLIWNQENHLDQDRCTSIVWFSVVRLDQNSSINRSEFRNHGPRAATSLKTASTTVLESDSEAHLDQNNSINWFEFRKQGSLRTATLVCLESELLPHSLQFHKPFENEMAQLNQDSPTNTFSTREAQPINLESEGSAHSG